MEMIPDNLTVRSRMNVILEHLEGKESITFLALFDGIENRVLVIVMFLALLELIKIKVIRVIQGEMFGSILVTRSFSTISGDEMEATMDSIDELSGGLEA
jgi:segregation and condensation protein A